MRSPTSALCSEPSPSITSTPPSPGSDSTDFSSALSWKAPHRRDRPRELRPAAVLAELQIAAADVGADFVDEVSGEAGCYGHRSMLARSNAGMVFPAPGRRRRRPTRTVKVDVPFWKSLEDLFEGDGSL